MQTSKKSTALGLVLGLAAAAVSALPLPIAFEANHGQTDPQVRFIARSRGSSLFLMEDGGAVLSLGKGADGERQTVRMSLVGGSPHPASLGTGEHGTASYYRGKDPARWHVGVPTWDSARYTAVYPGIDLVYYANENRLEHDFIVAPGADPKAILLRFDGLDQQDRPVTLDDEGKLRLATLAGEVVLEAPRVYQEVGGEKRAVAGRYELAGPGRVRFAVGEYDAARPLVIDPVLVFSSFLGGSGNDYAQPYSGADPSGNSFYVALAESDDFPLVAPIQSTRLGGFEIVISKVSADGSHLIYSTFLGGSGGDWPAGLAVDAAGNAYVGGLVDSLDFPVLNALQPTYGGGGTDFFVTKLSPAGALVYSTYLGGTESEKNDETWSSVVAVTPGGTLYLTGSTFSPNYPQVHPIQPGLTPGNCLYYWDPNPVQCADTVLTVLSPSGGQILYSTLLGGSGDEAGVSVAVDSDGAAYLLGYTGSADFPLANPFQSDGAIYIVKVRPDGTPPVYSTRFGAPTGQHIAWNIATDAEKNAYFFLATYTGDLPVKNAIQPVFGGGIDWYVAKINPRGTGLDFATYLGGADVDGGWRMAVDPLGNVAMAGYSLFRFDVPGPVEPSFPLLHPLQAPQLPDAFVAKIHGTGPTLLYSTPLGGSLTDTAHGVAMDARGEVYVAGGTVSPDFPLRNPFQPVPGDLGHRPDVNEAFVARLSDGLATLATPSRVPAQPAGTVTVPVRFTPGGFDIAFAALSIDYDESCLTFNPADANADGIPDAISFTLPPGFGKSVQFDAGDTDGEIDISIFDPSPPFALLPLGEPARITFGVKPTCGAAAVSTLVRVGFSSAPAVSFGDITGHSSPGISLDGSVEVWGGLRGDCNGDQAVNAGDLGAEVLELFDTDGTYWLDAPLSTFPGSPAGCDANADLAIDAGDLSCGILIIFQGPGACSPTPIHAIQLPLLELHPLRIAIGRGAGVTVPVRLTRGSANVNSVVFSLRLPENLTFDAADADGNGVPDAVAFRLPGGFVGSVQWTPQNRAGQLEVIVTDPTGQRKPLPDGVLASISLKWAGAPTASPQVRFGTAPAASFGDIAGRSTPGLTKDGSRGK